MRRPIRRLIPLATALLFLLASCGSETVSSGYTDESGERLTSYALEEGSFSYEVAASAKGSIAVGDALKESLPAAVTTALELLGAEIPVDMSYTAQIDIEVTAVEGGGQTVAVTYKDLSGKIAVASDTPTDVTLDGVAEQSGEDPVTATYAMSSNGEIALDGADPVADTFWATRGPEFCAEPPGQGATDGDEWETATEGGSALSWIVGPIEWTNTYAVQDEEGVVASLAEDPVNLEVDTKALIDRINESLGISLPDIDVKAAFAAEGTIEQSCTLSVPSQKLLGMAQDSDLAGDLQVSGESLPSGLSEGSILDLDLQSTYSMTPK